MTQALAPLVAIVGADGSGKSTLSADIAAELGGERPVAQAYLGLGSGDLGQRIKGWPLIGPAVERRIAAKAGRARDKNAKIPGLVTALVIYAFSIRRRRSFGRVLKMRRQGVAVITDRYPQVEVPGYYDGPGLSAAAAGSALVGWLAARERRQYERMAAWLPTLVIRLNITVETAMARQPDHGEALVAQKIATTPLLRFNGAPIADVDANRPYAQVRAEVIALVRKAFGA
ncbi:nucleoside triphosphate hydrolase [Sphingomonas canadensis]|uniref:Nucleoside triphosphate hydrolase n=1 Tax=Sphingomonas canadensis TaxID=1219257 RepID=A0ABW3H0I3_9SPHN|nr:nucleoside triphosphate hydrolase [Sphingomonas canadensis]MCW3835130.1 nucleoside triphosphate hydrolase [Sphingomonas canadensis]